MTNREIFFKRLQFKLQQPQVQLYPKGLYLKSLQLRKTSFLL